MSNELYAKWLYTNALCCGIAFEEKRVKALFFKGLSAFVCYNRHVNMEFQLRAPLTELVRYADTSIKIADESVLLASKPSEYRTAGVLPRLYKMSSRPVIGYRTHGSTMAMLKVLLGSYDNCRRTTSEPEGYWGSHRRLCLKNLRKLAQCPYTEEAGDALQQREESFKDFEDTVKSIQLYYCREYETFCGGRWYDHSRFARWDPQTLEAAVAKLISVVARTSRHPKG